VTYTYTVENCGTVTLTDVVVTDDNGTPDLPGDDFVVGTIPSLAEGASSAPTASGGTVIVSPPPALRDRAPAILQYLGPRL